MYIDKDATVCVEYTLKNADGVILDSSKENGNLEYIQGYNMVISGLEKLLTGKKAGDVFEGVIEPEDAYGDYFEDLVFETERSQFPEGTQLEVGMEFEAGDGHHSRIVKITKIDGDKITVDANHPLAGKTLYFSGKVISVEQTTEDKLQSLIQMMSEDGCGCCGHSSEDDDCCSCGCHGCH